MGFFCAVSSPGVQESIGNVTRARNAKRYLLMGRRLARRVSESSAIFPASQLVTCGSARSPHDFRLFSFLFVRLYAFR